jgi:hypothetical protein
MMAEHCVSVIEGMVHKVEDRIAEWRRHEAALESEAAANRSRLWAEAAERQRLVAATIGHEETRRGAPARETAEHELVFVVASDAFADALEHFSPERDRLVRVMPAGEGGGATGLRGSWLVFEMGRTTSANT